MHATSIRNVKGRCFWTASLLLVALASCTFLWLLAIPVAARFTVGWYGRFCLQLISSFVVMVALVVRIVLDADREPTGARDLGSEASGLSSDEPRA